MTPSQLHIVRHAIGLRDDGTGRAYRNHFVTGPGSTDYSDCCALVAAGHMACLPGNALTGGDPCFIVTTAGRAEAEDA